MDILAASGGGGAKKYRSAIGRGVQRKCIPSGAAALANDSDGVALEAELTSEAAGLDAEQAGDEVVLRVVDLLHAVAALNGADVAAVLDLRLGSGGDRDNGDGEGEDGGELGEHRESRWCARR